MAGTLIVKQMLFILLSIDRKMKTMLDDLCWFNSVNSLAEADTEEECLDIQMAKEWSQLWDCAGQTLCDSIRQQLHHQEHSNLHIQHNGLGCRKREELVFSFRNSNLYQLLVCRHAGGSDSESQAKKFVIST